MCRLKIKHLCKKLEQFSIVNILIIDPLFNSALEYGVQYFNVRYGNAYFNTGANILVTSNKSSCSHVQNMSQSKPTFYLPKKPNSACIYYELLNWF